MESDRNERKLVYFLSTKAGAVNGMIPHNLREIPAENLNLSLNFVDMLQSKKVLESFKKKFADKDVKYDFLMLKPV